MSSESDRPLRNKRRMRLSLRPGDAHARACPSPRAQRCTRRTCLRERRTAAVGAATGGVLEVTLAQLCRCSSGTDSDSGLSWKAILKGRSGGALPVLREEDEEITRPSAAVTLWSPFEANSHSDRRPQGWRRAGSGG